MTRTHTYISTNTHVLLDQEIVQLKTRSNHQSTKNDNHLIQSTNESSQYNCNDGNWICRL